MLSLAVNWDSLELLNLLIEWGVTIEMVNKDELFNGILSGHRPHKTVQRLIELKLDISSPNLYGRTLLHVAAQVGDEGFVEMLCQAGVPLNFFWGSNPPSTPLTVAAIYGHERVVDLLIKYGATVDVDERFIKEHSEAIKLKLQRARRNQQLRRGLTYASPLVVVLAYLTAHWLI
jgi:ankyrin repeat protein